MLLGAVLGRPCLVTAVASAVFIFALSGGAGAQTGAEEAAADSLSDPVRSETLHPAPLPAGSSHTSPPDTLEITVPAADSLEAVPPETLEVAVPATDSLSTAGADTVPPGVPARSDSAI